MAQATYHDPPEAIGSQSCPSEAELRAVAEGSLPDPQLDTILQHLTECDRCEASLARLAEEQTRAEEYRLPAAAESVVHEPECLRMQDALRDLAQRIARNHAEPDEESTDKSRLSTDDGKPKRLAAALDATTTFVPTIPRKIGRYEVRSLLGEGAYGQVFLAHDPQLDRQVAIKVAKYSAAIIREQFLREAKVAAKLKHPGIVTVYDADVDENVGCYIVMEYVEGKSLKQVIEEGRASPEKKISHEKAADYIAQAAEALAEAHKIDLVHRDIKPANLLLDKDGRIKVADFGLAIFEEEQRKRAGEFAGTIAYCSPEQIRGEVHRLDGRTDLWSLGVVFYELLTGRRPFGGPNIADEILHRPPKPPRQINGTIPRDLASICTNCLNTEAKSRCSSGSDLALSLRTWVVHSRPRIQRRRTILAIGVAILFFASVSATIGFTRFRRSSHLPIEAPNVVAWEPRDLRDQYGYDATNKCFRFDAYGHALFSVATVKEDNVDLTMEVTVRRWNGRAIIFWGLHRTPDGLSRCWAVSVGRFKQGMSFRVDLCEYGIDSSGAVKQSSCLKTIRCDEPISESASLRVVGSPGVVDAIWLNGEPLLPEPYRFPRPTAARAPYSVGFGGDGGDVGEISISQFSAN